MVGVSRTQTGLTGKSLDRLTRTVAPFLAAGHVMRFRTLLSVLARPLPTRDRSRDWGTGESIPYKLFDPSMHLPFLLLVHLLTPTGRQNCKGVRRSAHGIRSGIISVRCRDDAERLSYKRSSGLVRLFVCTSFPPYPVPPYPLPPYLLTSLPPYQP